MVVGIGLGIPGLIPCGKGNLIMWTYEIQIASIVIAIAVGVISKICYDWLSGSRAISKNSDTNELLKTVNIIKELVTKSDSEGTPLIYNTREAIKLSKEHNDRSIETNFLLKDIKDLLKENGSLMREVMREVQSLTK